ncbi:hypothetical protein [Pseudoduganella violaceinigra]|uniref:hypothetical protein n=1 Tax=Pseudoduganella violaceinigra TaxID=246602 RepID=UPI00041F06C8|nr:hypothetical protein [Pseudoduganella violaceinigra]
MALQLRKSMVWNAVLSGVVAAVVAVGIACLINIPGFILGLGVLAAGVAAFLQTAAKIRAGTLAPLQELASYVRIERESTQKRQQVDWSVIDDYAAQLATRGFRPLGDYTAHPMAAALQGVAALFTDAEGSIVIEIQQLQLRPEAGRDGMRDGIYFSIMSMVGGCIRVITCNHKPRAATYVMRGEHDVMTAQPGKGLFELLVTHTDLLTRLREKVGKAPATGLTVERYVLAIREAQAQARIRVSGMSGYAIACEVDRFQTERTMRWTPQIADLKQVPQRRLDELDSAFAAAEQPPVFHDSLATQF